MQTVNLRSGKVVSLLGTPILDGGGNITGYNGVTANGNGAGKYKDSPYSTFQASVTGTGSVAATITFQVSNDNVNWVATPLGTITLSGTTSASDGFTTQSPWKYVRANVSGIAGTGATVVVLMGI